MHEARHAGGAAGLKQIVRAVDIGAHEGRSILNAAIDVALRGEVDDGIAPADLLRDGGIADIHLHKMAMASAQLGFKVREIARVGELVEDNQLPVRMLGDGLVNEVGADESRTAGNKQLHAPRTCVTSSAFFTAS